MNYIYDIYLNFNKTYYDFYEWNNNDKVMHIKKIPLFKVSTSNLKRMISNKIIISNDIFNSIKNKTDIYNSKEKLSSLIITDSKNVFALKLDKNGETSATSSLLLEDELDIIAFSLKTKEHNIDYKIVCKNKYLLSTRKEIDEKKYVLNILNKISYDTLKYLYYDYFNKEEENKDIMLKELLKEVQHNYTLNSHIYNLLKPITTN